jgi:hypothetical protein
VNFAFSSTERSKLARAHVVILGCFCIFDSPLPDFSWRFPGGFRYDGLSDGKTGWPENAQAENALPFAIQRLQ